MTTLSSDPEAFYPPPMTEMADAAYRITSDGAFYGAYAWQAELYGRLSQADQDAGHVLLAPAGSGKVEAVVVPSLGFRRGGAPRRLFVVTHSGWPLDDLVHRFVPYLRAWAVSDESPRTMFVDRADGSGSGTRYGSDGAQEEGLAMSPLEADVDLVLTTLDRFEDLFFGGGGMHALPSALAADDPTTRRDLFFFDEAHDYGALPFGRFRRLVEFLFAQDADVIVGSSTMPASYQEELSFLEMFVPGSIQNESGESRLLYEPGATILSETKRAMADLRNGTVGLADPQPRRRSNRQERSPIVVAILESPEQAETIHEELARDGEEATLYHELLPVGERRELYQQLKSRPVGADPILVVATGNAFEASDLDAAVAITGVCTPERLIRRAGRVNRRGRWSGSRLVVCLTETPARVAVDEKYLSALRAASGVVFEPEAWMHFI